MDQYHLVQRNLRTGDYGWLTERWRPLTLEEAYTVRSKFLPFLRSVDRRDCIIEVVDDSKIRELFVFDAEG